MRSSEVSVVVAHPEEPCSVACRLKLQMKLHTFTLIVSLLFLAEQVAEAYVNTNTGQLLTSVKQNPQLPTLSAGPSQNGADVPALEVGKPVERELAGGGAHSYHVALAAGQYLHVIVEQHSVDVEVRAFAPDGELFAEFNSPSGPVGREPVRLLAESRGNYRLEVRWLWGAAGRYEIKIAELRAATRQDRDRVSAEHAYREGRQLHTQGNADSVKLAAEKYNEALSLLRAVGDRAREAAMLTGVGGDYFTSRDKQKALQYYSQALSLYRAIGDRQQEAVVLNGIGAVHLESGESGKALDHFNQSLSLFRDIGERALEPLLLHNIALTHNGLGDLWGALVYYDQALTSSRSVGNHDGKTLILIRIGEVYRRLNEHQKALDHLTQALALSRAAGDRRPESNVLGNIGFVYNTRGEHHKAIDYFNQSLAISRIIRDHWWERFILRRAGITYSELGETQKALDYFNQALSLSRTAGDRQGEAITLVNISRTYNSLGDKQRALDYYGQALPMFRAAGHSHGEAETLYEMARVHRDKSDLTQARAYIEASLLIIESSRSRFGNPELSAFSFASVQQYYSFYIDLLMQLHWQHPSDGYDARALQASERARARSLLELLTEARADIRQGSDSKLLERERGVQQRLNRAAERQTRLLGRKHTEEQAAAAAKEFSGLVIEYELVQARIRQTSPRYAALTQPQPLSLTEVQLLLDGDTLLLEFALGEERSYLWAVTATARTSYVLPKRSEIERQAQHVYELLTARNRLENDETVGQRRTRLRHAEVEYIAAATDLSRVLLAPVSAQIKGKRLIVVADGALQYVPFAALPEPTKPAGGAWQPLVVRHEVVSLPSASVLSVIRQEQERRQPAPKRVAVLADPVFKETDRRVRASTMRQETTSTKRVAGAKEASASTPQSLGAATLKISAGDVRLMDGADFPRLEYTRELAQVVFASTPADEAMQALDFAASRATATSSDLRQYRTVIFATHGLLNSRHPELSGLVLSLVDEEGRAQDGFLRLHDVYNMTLNADLVVLGACETGLGKEIRGEGLVGLTRGFMYAGARRVMASLWKVDEDATVELIKRMYNGIEREGQTPAAALRTAQVSMFKEKRFKSPYYWAGFVLQGEYK